MRPTIDKKKITQAIAELPENTTVEEAIERLTILHKVEVGLRQSEEDKGISQTKVENHFQQRREDRDNE